jgi:hypothetical protein
VEPRSRQQANKLQIVNDDVTIFENLEHQRRQSFIAGAALGGQDRVVTIVQFVIA